MNEWIQGGCTEPNTVNKPGYLEEIRSVFG